MIVFSLCVVSAIALFAIDPSIIASSLTTASYTGPISLLASLIGLPLALYFQLYHDGIRSWIVCLSIFAIVLPSPAIATALMDRVFVDNPFALPTLLVTVFLGYFPLILFAQCALLMNISRDSLAISYSLGSSIPRILSRAYWKSILTSVALPAVITSIIAGFDPAISLASAGSRDYFGGSALHSNNLYVDESIRHGIILLVVLACAWLTALIRRFRADTLDTMVEQFPLRPSPRFTLLTATILSVLSLAYFVVAISIYFAGVNALLSYGASSFSVSNTVGASLLVSLVSLGLGTCIGTFLAYVSFTRTRLYLPIRDLCIFILTLGMTCAGMIIAALDTWLGGSLSGIVFPPLVGGAGVAQGAAAIALSELAITMPVIYLVTDTILRRHTRMIGIARDAGAHNFRTFFSVIIPLARLPWTCTYLISLALLLTRALPSAFVDSPAWPQAGHSLAIAASEGNSALVYALGTITSFIALAFALITTIIVRKVQPSRRYARVRS